MATRKSSATKGRRRVRFTLQAPDARDVALVGEFNGWDATAGSMRRAEEGFWEKTLLLPPGHYQYKYLVDGQWWNDPQGEAHCANCFGSTNDILHVTER